MAELRLLRGQPCLEEAAAAAAAEEEEENDRAASPVEGSDSSSSSSLSSSSSSSSSSACSLLLSNNPVIYYEVHPRDTLAEIANMFRTTIPEIRSDNRGYFAAGEQGCLVPGLLLKIRNPDWNPSTVSNSSSNPLCLNGMVMPSTPQRPLSFSSSSSYIGSLSPSGSGSSSPATGALRRQYHDVKEGETLDDIARLYKVDRLDIRKWNRRHFPVGERARDLQIGVRLLIYYEAAALGDAAGRNNGISNVILDQKRGERRCWPHHHQ